MSRPTLRALLQLPTEPAPLSKSTLIMIDCQRTYREGIMELEGVEAALKECAALLERARSAGAQIVHIQHEVGPGSPYDTNAPIGQIADLVAPLDGETVITKTYPSAFEKTSLAEDLLAAGNDDLVLAGFMTHMCVNSTARAAFNHGYRPTVVASATATRALPGPDGASLPARQVHDAALASMHDLFAIVVPNGSRIPD